MDVLPIITQTVAAQYLVSQIQGQVQILNLTGHLCDHYHDHSMKDSILWLLHCCSPYCICTKSMGFLSNPHRQSFLILRWSDRSVAGGKMQIRYKCRVGVMEEYGHSRLDLKASGLGIPPDWLRQKRVETPEKDSRAEEKNPFVANMKMMEVV